MKNIMAENEILGGILYNNKIAAECISELTIEDFYSTKNRKLFTSMRNLYGKGTELNNLLYKKVGDVKVGNNTTKRSIKDDLKVRPKDNINKNIIANNIKSVAIEVIDYLNTLSSLKYNI